MEGYRRDLAEKLKSAPKEKREEILDEAKQTPEYQIARNEKIQANEEEEEIEGGLGILVKKKTLYHGSGISGIETFNVAEEDTVGNGAYFTSKAEDAIGYARIRSKRERYEHRADGKPVLNDSQPVIYESSVENMKLLDLRKDENLKKVLPGFADFLLERREKRIKDNDNVVDNYAVVLRKVINDIDSGKIRYLKEAAHQAGTAFSDYVKSLGYEGLVALEGGEGVEVGNHDSYVIFSPEKAKVIREQKLGMETAPVKAD